MAAVAPMDLVVKSDASSIPLRCTICPKRPNFSDLSHLLTHISSKSHLAHRFKVELKARGDRDALEEIRQYDDWCERYGINALLAERMAAKEQKKTNKRGRQSHATQGNRRDVGASRRNEIKPEPEEYTPSLPAASPWSVDSAGFRGGNQGYFDNSGYHVTNLKRARSDNSAPNTPENGTRLKYRRWPSETETTDSAVVSELPSESTDLMDDENDASRLKGVRYPGMGLFDSADEAQKRMRNQRKDDSVLRQMEETSSGIEPNEFVWTENGEFQRIRDIYASPSIEGSPDRKFEERDVHKHKRARLSSTFAAPESSRQKRSSARITRQVATQDRIAQEEDLLLEHDDNVGSRISNHNHGSIETFDIFRDPPKPGSARTDSLLGESGFELRRRPALQTLNSNISLASSASNTGKPLSYFANRDSATSPLTSHPSIPAGHYFQHHQSMEGGTFNPLCVQNRGGYYNTYSYTNYGNEPKPAAANFQAVNTMNLGNMSFNAFAGPYASDSAHERVDQDFDL